MNEIRTPNHNDQVEHQIEIWKKTIEVQQHFNDIGIRIRNFALTLILAVFGATGLAIKENLSVDVFGIDCPFAILLLIAGLIGWGSLYLMDRYWYHRLLYGAVTHGIEIEKLIEDKVQGIGLSKTIKEESSFKRRGRSVFGSKTRMDVFYGVVAGFIILLIIGMICS